MQDLQKLEIRDKLAKYCQRYPSNNMAAASLKNVSAATLSNILTRKWEKISDDMWKRLEAQLTRSDDWRIFSTAAYQDVTVYLDYAQEQSSVMWVVAPAGIGKSTAASSYTATHRNVYRLTCATDMTRSDFVRELAAQIGVRTNGMSLRESFNELLRQVVTLDKPLLVFDEADKLADSVMYYFISIYNALEGRCGIVFLSTPAIKKRITNGVMRDKKGYDEIESRICRRYIDVTPVTASEIEQICLVNNLSDANAITRVKNDVKAHGNDLRRVKQSVKRELARTNRITA